jgi:hypothetical protein
MNPCIVDLYRKEGRKVRFQARQCRLMVMMDFMGITILFRQKELFIISPRQLKMMDHYSQNFQEMKGLMFNLQLKHGVKLVFYQMVRKMRNFEL